MPSDAARLRRARLIERVRTADQSRAATEAHQAETNRRKLAELVERTRSLGAVYAAHDTFRDGADLTRAAVLGARLHDLGRNAARQAEQAGREADDKLALLAAAERRLQSANEKRDALERARMTKLAQTDGVPAARTGIGTEVE